MPRGGLLLHLYAWHVFVIRTLTFLALHAVHPVLDLVCHFLAFAVPRLDMTVLCQTMLYDSVIREESYDERVAAVGGRVESERDCEQTRGLEMELWREGARYVLVLVFIW
jgi:hypothetical protein